MRKNTQRREQLQNSCYRTEVVRMRVTPVEREDLARRATQSGEKTLSDYLRKRALEFGPQPVVPEINLEVARELRRMSAHLHSLALFAQRASSTGQMPKQNYEILRGVWQTVGRVPLGVEGFGAGERRGSRGRFLIFRLGQDLEE